LFIVLSYHPTAGAFQNDQHVVLNQTLSVKQPASSGLSMTDDDLNAQQIKRIGILTGGGLAPGHNAVIAAVVKAAHAKGIKVIPVFRGWEGLYREDLIKESLDKGPLSVGEVTATERKGGSIIRTSRFNPMNDKKKAEIMLHNMKDKLKLDAMIACGGDDTCTAAKGLTLLAEELGLDLKFLALPKTIDNDLKIPSNSNTYGFRTFTNEGIKAAQSVKEEAMSRNSIMVMEVMGRSAGHIALRIGAGVNATVTIVPEEAPVDFRKLTAQVEHFYNKYRYALIVVAEGAHLQYQGNEEYFNAAPAWTMDLLNASKNASTDSFGHKKLENVGLMLTNVLAGYFGNKSTGEQFVNYTEKVSYGARARQIAPTDVNMCTVLGNAAVDYLVNGKANRLLYVVEKRAYGNGSSDIIIQHPLEDPAYRHHVRLKVQDIDLSTDPDLRGRVALIAPGERDHYLYVQANMARFEAVLGGPSKEAVLFDEIKPDIWERKLLTVKPKQAGVKRIALMTCGDLLPGFNTIITSIIREAQESKAAHQIVGIQEGWRGLVRDHLIEETFQNGIVKNVPEDLLKSLSKRGGSLLRTSDMQLPQTYTDPLFEKIKSNIVDLELDTLIVAGGIETVRSAQRLREFCSSSGLNLEIIVLPKVIGKINGEEESSIAYGYRTFVTQGTHLAESIMLEAQALNRVMVIDIDDKNDGFSALRIGADIGATFTFVGESEPIDLEDLIKRMQLFYNAHGYGVVIASEGARLLTNFRNNDIYLDKLFAKYPLMKTLFELSYGRNASVSMQGEFIGPILTKILNMELKPLPNVQESTVATYGDKIGVFVRSQRVLPEDYKIADHLGQAAYEIATRTGINAGAILYVDNETPKALPITSDVGARQARIKQGGKEHSKWRAANVGLFDTSVLLPEQAVATAA
jgi:6-phosphofructokinase 1